MKKQILSVALGLSLLAVGAKAQSHDHSKMTEGNHHSTSATYQTPEAFQQQLAEVYQASLDLKEAFVASSKTQVKEAVNPVQEALSKVDMKLLKDHAHMDWMDHLKTIKSNLETVEKSNAIDEQRKGFTHFSEALYQSIKAFGIGDEEAYYQYCPMANNNKGAYWLSDNKEIRNPYFGDKMLKCGTVKESL
ncbi:hypothetical protein OKW21_004441 [Catalinimonas alkaloidigena]|uniref:DUF3347 domain-containing protein n=1 Tax=Catalinimonas alkaloidigena TaxID=1075417 RepID=UPI002406DC53|nr:DUF3347 domain-containing protein [Catalinimonas alkaloidigena]MDF9799178.1 hypothetical protein [Catalinimonas alkaloidigena]